MASTINLLRLLADPTRLRLLLLLEQEELSVAELQQILGMGQSRISTHLAQLKRAGVVADRRVGKNVYYGANHDKHKAQRKRVAEVTRLLARELPEGSRDRTSLKLVLQKRQDKARKYFDELAGKFVVDLIVDLLTQANSTRLGQRLDPGGNIYSITKDVVLPIHHVTHVNANAYLDFEGLARRRVIIP